MIRKFFILLFLLSLSGCGRSPAVEVAVGNEAFEAGDYEQAMDAYQNAQDLAPVQAEPLYNLANTRYRQGVYTDTVQLLPQAVAIADEQVEQQGYFNLGNANFQLQDWAVAVEAYKDALRRNPADLDAKYNLELAMRNLQNEQQNQDQNQENQDQQDQSDQNESEQDNSEQSQQDESQSDQPQDQPQDQEQEQQGQDQPEENGQDQQEQSADSQPNEPTEQDPQGGSGSEEEQPDPAQAQQPQNVQPQQGLSQEQARQLLNAVGKNAQTLQEQMQQIYVSPEGAPEKDW